MISAIGLQLSGMIYISQVKTRPHENPYFFMNSRDCHDQDSCTHGGCPVEYLPKFQLVCQTGKRVGMLEPHHQNREIAKTSGAELNEDTQGGAAGWLCRASGHQSREVFVPIYLVSQGLPAGSLSPLELCNWKTVAISILLRKVRKGPQWTSTHQFHHQGWMICCDQETVFCWVPVPYLTMVVT